MSSLLFYGPGAKDFALRKAYEVGRLIQPLFGLEGLKTEEARRIVEVINTAPVGDQKGVVLIGPMDLANAKASDVLLKSLEEFPEEQIQPILWADDLGSLVPTVRSRCLSHWCPGEKDISEKTQGLAFQILEAKKDYHTLIGLLKENKSDLNDIIRGMIWIFASQPTDTNLRIWSELRKIMVQGDPSWMEVLTAILVGGTA